MRPVVFNYTKAFTEAPLLRYLLNGVIVTASIFLLQVVVALDSMVEEEVREDSENPLVRHQVVILHPL